MSKLKEKLVIEKNHKLGVVAYTYNPSTIRRIVNSRPAWAT
jgi:hypothetical protein